MADTSGLHADAIRRAVHSSRRLHLETPLCPCGEHLTPQLVDVTGSYHVPAWAVEWRCTNEIGHDWVTHLVESLEETE